jgi:hypothetical protein
MGPPFGATAKDQRTAPSVKPVKYVVKLSDSKTHGLPELHG